MTSTRHVCSYAKTNIKTGLCPFPEGYFFLYALYGLTEVDLGPSPEPLGAARVQGESRLAAGLAGYGDLIGLPLDTPHTRRYAFGLLPIGDAFLAWSKSARPLVAPVQTGLSPGLPRGWRAPLLALFIAVAACPWLLLLATRCRRRS